MKVVPTNIFHIFGATLILKRTTLKNCYHECLDIFKSSVMLSSMFIIYVFLFIYLL